MRRVSIAQDMIYRRNRIWTTSALCLKRIRDVHHGPSPNHDSYWHYPRLW